MLYIFIIIIKPSTKTNYSNSNYRHLTELHNVYYIYSLKTICKQLIWSHLLLKVEWPEGWLSYPAGHLRIQLNYLNNIHIFYGFYRPIIYLWSLFNINYENSKDRPAILQDDIVYDSNCRYIARRPRQWLFNYTYRVQCHFELNMLRHIVHQRIQLKGILKAELYYNHYRSFTFLYSL